MKHTSVFYSLPVKILTVILCFSCLLGCGYCILRSAWMEAVGILDDPPSCEIVTSNWGKLYYPSWWYDGMEIGTEYHSYDELAFLIGHALEYDTVTGSRKDGVCVIPTDTQNSFSEFLTYHGLKESNFAFRILLEDADGNPYVFFSNMEDITEEDLLNPSSGSFTEWEPETDGDDSGTRGVFSGYDENGREIWTSYTAQRTGSFLYGLRRGLPCQDEYADYYAAWERDSKNAMFWVGSAISLGALGVGLLLLMLCQAGVHRGEEAVRLSLFDRLPAEIAIAIHTGLFILAVAVGIEVMEIDTQDILGFLFGYRSMTLPRILYLLCAVGLLAVMLALILHFLVCAVRRLRAGGWWKNTVTYRVLRISGRCAVALFLFCSAVFSKMRLLWKWLVFCACFWLWTCLVMAGCSGVPILVLLWCLTELAVCAFGALYLMGMDRVCRGAEIIASGKLDHSIDKKRLIGTPYHLAETLDHIRDAMQTAVSEQMRAERFRTELITNVSHDLKTPLTSIINYTDLLSKEAEKETPDRGAEREYLDVLSRQSERLRRLTADLLEASKASTGSLSVTLAPTDAVELLSQALGEYESRLTGAGLTPVLQAPDTPVTVRADGKHLWRVFDNLLSNICKYSLSGTRVYLTVETAPAHVRFLFRNISAVPLNISAQELTERFVRGDESRHTEGSGLGLAIAQSLTDLQGGTLSLSVDGDLFKAVVEMPRMI